MKNDVAPKWWWVLKLQIWRNYFAPSAFMFVIAVVFLAALFALVPASQKRGHAFP